MERCSNGVLDGSGVNVGDEGGSLEVGPSRGRTWTMKEGWVGQVEQGTQSGPLHPVRPLLRCCRSKGVGGKPRERRASHGRAAAGEAVAAEGGAAPTHRTLPQRDLPTHQGTPTDPPAPAPSPSCGCRPAG